MDPFRGSGMQVQKIVLATATNMGTYLLPDPKWVKGLGVRV